MACLAVMFVARYLASVDDKARPNDDGHVTSDKRDQVIHRKGNIRMCSKCNIKQLANGLKIR